MIRILFVCLGNICRSPLAEGIFRHLVEEAGLESRFVLDSAGTNSYHTGQLADRRTRQVAESRGIVLTHRARTFTQTDFKRFDLILAMDESNLENIKRMQPHGGTAVLKLMRDYDSKGQGEAVPDPYYGDMGGFEAVHDILQRSCQGLLAHCQERFER